MQLLQALQIFDVLRVVGSSHVFSAGLVIGGKDVQSEQELISTMNILVATPGRLLQHMDETPGFDCSSLLMLILDEADRMLDMGFEKTMNAIVDNLPKRRQTLLFSATLTKSVKALARLSLSRDAEVIGVHDTSKPKVKGAATAATGDAEGQFDMPRKLSHSYMVCELDKKLNVLYSFAKTHLNSKMIVFLSSCKQTKFFYEAIRRARPGLSVMCMHGRMKQMKRMAAYCRFCEERTKGSMLLATDVAARGLDFPSIDWVLQLDCPEDVATYIHRSGRTARYRSSGRSLLFLLPSEREVMLAKLSTEAKIVPRQVSMNAGKSFDLQESLAGWVAADPELKFLAQKAFVTFVRSYYLQKDKEVFDVGALPLEAYASALGLPGAPRIRLVKKSKSKSKLASTAPGAASDKDSGTESEEDDVDAPAAGSRPVRRDNVARLMQRKNVGVLNPTRASLREDDSSGDESDDLMQIKRRDHDLPERSEDGAMQGSDVDAEAAQKAELKKMSRKQRRIAKQVARGEVPRDSDAHKMRDGDTSIEGWKESATTYAAEVRDRVAEQDTGDKGREKDRVRAKHRAERAARRAYQAEREGLRGAGEIEAGYQVELGSPSDDDMDSGEVSDRRRSDGNSNEDSEGSVAAGGTRTAGKRKQQIRPVDSDSDVEAESHPKRHQIASPAGSVDLQAIAAQLLQSRSLI